MKKEANEIIINKMNLDLNEDFLNDDFVKNINTLSDSIKEYYKVTKNTNQNKTILLNAIEKKLNESESISNILFSENNEDYNNVQSYNEVSKKIIEFFIKLKENINSDQRNLFSFFEDAKIIFKKLKDYRQEYIQNKIKKQRLSYSFKEKKNKNMSPNIYHKINNIQNQYQNSEINFNNFEIQKNRVYPLTNRIENNNNFDKQNLRTMIQKENISDDSYKMNKTSDSKKIKKYTDNNKFLNEIEKLKNINKKYEFNIRRLNLDLKKYQSELEILKKARSFNNILSKTNEENDNNQIIQDELSINKDKIISSLKSEIEKNNKKYSDLFNNYRKLQEENKRLQIKNGPNNNIYNKLNNLIKENIKLKNNIELLRTNAPNNNSQSDLNYKLNVKKFELDFNNKNYIKEIDALKKKILLVEKNLADEQLKNKELKNENNMLKNKHELEKQQLSKRNVDLSTKLINKQNELLILQKDILGKTKEIENLKISLNSIDSQNNQMLIESIKTIFEQENNSVKNSVNRPWNNLNESLNRILENYKNENQELKINFHEKIKYYQEQLKSAKNELLEKIQTNTENDIKNKKQINDIKNDYDKKMEEVNNKNKIIDHYLNLYQEVNNNLMNRLCQTNQKVSAKDMKIIQLQEENQQLKEKIEELYNLKDSNNLNNIDLKIKEENINLIKKLDEQKQTNEKLKEELKVISNEHNIYQKRLLSLGVKFIGEHEFKISKDEAFERLNDEIEQLKGQNETLKDMIETLTKDFLSKNKEKKENNEKYDDEVLKKQYDELEGLKQKTYKYINEQGNNGDEMNILKKENEKLTKQIMKFSNEYTELQKQYDELENRYKFSLKNENKIPNSNSNITTTTYDEIANELKKVKKENEQIRKKNLELISQLEEKEIKHDYDNKSEDGYKSNYEEEFDLRKMAKGAKEKNRSQDINIDYPGIQAIKEKYRELDFYYNSLETLVKKLLLNVQVGPKNKTYVNELCKIVGFDLETTNKILNNKNSKKLLGLFQK